MPAADGYSIDSTSISLQDPTPNPLLPELNNVLANITAKQLIHVVMVPYPVQGQITPMTQFAKLLTAAKPSDVDILVTMVHNQHNYDCIQHVRRGSVDHADAFPATQLALIQAASNSQSKVQFTWVENGLPPDFNYSDITGACALEFYLSTLRMKEPLKQLLQSFKQQGAPVSCVLFGTFCTWAQSAAAEVGIPTRFFSTQSATLFSIYYHIPRLVASGSFKLKKQSFSGCGGDSIDTTELVTCIPGLPPLHPTSLPTFVNDDKDAEYEHYLALLEEQFSAVGSCDGVIINSFEELEKDAFEALRQQLPCSISLVGPLLPSAFLAGNDASDASIGASLLREKSDCIKWLDGKQKHSILYIAFGSLFNPSVDEVEGIALGIQSCKQPYLWVMRPNPSFPDISDILPKGFVEDTREYGLIITWAPQLQVLSHPSVGAFLTHCGWNSILEGLSMGMPMVAFPICIDQPTNSTYVCDFWKVGVALKRQEDGKVKSEDVEKALSTVFHEEEGLRMRERASKLRDAARRAVRAHGSSYGHVEGFIQALRNHAVQK